jgi:hypothetical protein
MEPTNSQQSEGLIIIDRPRICCLDIDKSTLQRLNGLVTKIYNGSLGSKIQVPNSPGSGEHQLLLNHDFPANLHEYDILIVDLFKFETIKYQIEEHTRENNPSKSSIYLVSSYPQTIFDPRPLASHLLKTELQEMGEHKHLIIIFASNSYTIEYEPIEITRGSHKRLKSETYNIYSLLDFPPLSNTITGKEIKFCTYFKEFQTLLEKYFIKDSYYNQTFSQRTKWSPSGSVNDENFIPLMTNMNGNIISFIELSEKENLIVLPQIEDKTEFLFDLLSFVTPSIFPDLFPFSSAFKWKEDKRYWLPNHSKLVDKLTETENEFEKRIQDCFLDIEQNKTKFSFLHDIVTETGKPLVNSIINYFEWLGYTGIKDMDDEKPEENIFEEDIQIYITEGLLIIECKGIGGTSTDSDCSQISKIKHRRCKERGEFDVYALYLVNHQRYLPPLHRQNPPFTSDQIRDAINDERGLLTTWQLFNLYSDIENGIISREEAMHAILSYGFVEFKPANIIYLDEPKELFQNGTICIINLNEIALTIDDIIYIEKNGKFEISKIIDIQINDKSVNTVSYGEIGIKLDKKVNKNSKLWKKGNS